MTHRVCGSFKSCSFTYFKNSQYNRVKFFNIACDTGNRRALSRLRIIICLRHTLSMRREIGERGERDVFRSIFSVRSVIGNSSNRLRRLLLSPKSDPMEKHTHLSLIAALALSLLSGVGSLELGELHPIQSTPTHKKRRWNQDERGWRKKWRQPNSYVSTCPL